jgi:hypothetical protein
MAVMSARQGQESQDLRRRRGLIEGFDPWYLEPDWPARRTCLRCDGVFDSNGPWNQICQTCKGAGQHPEDYCMRRRLRVGNVE